MTPYADQFMQSLLEEAWKTIQAGGLDAWKRIFPQSLPEKFATDAWTNLTTKGLSFLSAYSVPAEDPRGAVISVALTPETQRTEFLGNAHGQVDVTAAEPDNDRYTSYNQAALHIYIYGTPKSTVRALHSFVLAAVYSNQEWLTTAGFEQMAYLGASDLNAQPDLEPHQVTIFGRVVRFSFSAMSDIGSLVLDTTAPSWITVADESVSVDKYVNPTTGDEHDLDEIVAGAMKPRSLDE